MKKMISIALLLVLLTGTVVLPGPAYAETSVSYCMFGLPSVEVWSSWSKWQQSRKTISDPRKMQEESKTVYWWWAAQCTKCGTNNPYHGKAVTCHGCGQRLYNNKGLWKTVFAYTTSKDGMRSISGRKDGIYINGTPFWGPKKGTAYRYRTLLGSTPR